MATVLPPMPGAFFVGDRRVEPSLHQVIGPAGSLHLEPKVMCVLVALAEHAGEVVAKDRLFASVWPDVFVGDEVLARAISELRRVFGDEAKAPRFIETIPKSGYRLIAPVTVAAIAAKPLEVEPEQLAAMPVARAPHRLVLGTLVVLVLAAGSIILISRARSFVHADSPPPMKVVPFTTMPGVEGGPTFSPDGSRIAFHASPRPDSPDSRIMVKLIGVDPPQELTHGPGDAYPAWSPDGRWIAFVRDAAERSGLYLVPAVGGEERRVSSRHGCGGPAWSPDSRTLAFGGATTLGSCVNLYAVSLGTLETRDLTPAVGAAGPVDWFPAYSPDGRTIAFVRYRGAYVGDIYLMPAAGGTPKRLTFDDNTVWGRPAWTPDAAGILFVSSRMGSPTLWRIPTTGGQPERLGIDADADVALDANHHQLATVLSRINVNLNAIDLTQPTRPPVKIAPSTYIDEAPSFSADGQKIAFRSNRLGHNDIWVADADGSNAKHLTAIEHGNNGSPQWSPDGERVVFDSSGDGHFDLFVVRVAGGDPIRLTNDPSNDAVPTWSRDGRWIYFESDRSGSNQVWRMSADGGAATQVTKHGGFGGFESADRKYLYYTKAGPDGVWRVPVDGGLEEPVLRDAPRGDHLRSWALVESGIYYLDAPAGQQPSIQFFSFATHRTSHVVTLNGHVTPTGGPTLTVSPDGRTMIIQIDESMGSDIVRVENFR